MSKRDKKQLTEKEMVDMEKASVKIASVVQDSITNVNIVLIEPDCVSFTMPIAERKGKETMKGFSFRAGVSKVVTSLVYKEAQKHGTFEVIK